MLLEHLRPLLSNTAATRLCIAYSGGLDSTVLLDGVAALLPALSTFGTVELSALHVHHGLSANADAWPVHCVEQCRRRRVPLSVERVNVVVDGAGLEAAARKARYEAFARLDADYVLLAHHQNDQAETLLFNLLRGAGVLGAAAIPARQERLLRPLLDCSREELQAYAGAHDLVWIEDESNASLSHSRNYLRHKVLPLLQERFAGASGSLARAAEHFAQTQQLLEEVAIEDGAAETPLAIELLASLLAAKGKARAMNALAFNLRKQGVRLPSRQWLEQAFRQLLVAGSDRQIRLLAGDIVVRRYQGKIYVAPTANTPLPVATPWHGESLVSWGDGCIHAYPSKAVGINSAVLSERCELRLRQGGELMQLAGKPHRPLKDLLREAGIPPWHRTRLPLLFRGEELVWVPGVGIAEKYRCKAEEDGISLEFACPNW